jgi:sodium-dependent dicarboxylate transporter 2/3/5
MNLHMSSKESLPLISEGSNSKNPMLVLGPLLAFGVSTLIFNFGLLDLDAAITLGIALWTALWWIFEAVPIPVASLLPLSLLPLFGILSPKVVGEKYGHPLVLLLLGGFLLSKAMEKKWCPSKDCPDDGQRLPIG